MKPLPLRRTALLCLVFPMLILIASCSNGPDRPAPIDFAAAWCAQNEPWRFSAAEIAVMSRAAKENALRHNRQGARLCGWRPS